MTGTSQSGYTLVGVESFDEKVTNSSDGDEENKDSVPVSFYANVASKHQIRFSDMYAKFNGGL